MANDYFNHSANRVPDGARAVADHINDVADEIAVGFDKLPSEAELKQGKLNYAQDTGTPNNYAITLTYTPTLSAGLAVSFQAANDNTGPSTLNVNGTGAKSILSNSGSPLTAGQISAGQIIELRYDGSAYRVMATDVPATGIKAIYESNPDTNAFTDAEKAKLAGIEDGATADLTAAEVKALYEANADTNAFTDAEKSKLSGIASGANNYTHPSYSGADLSLNIGTLSGATVLDTLTVAVNTDTSGHVTSVSQSYTTRNLTASDISALPIAGGTITGALVVNGWLSARNGLELQPAGYNEATSIYFSNGDMNLYNANGGIVLKSNSASTHITFDLDAGTGTGVDWIATSDRRLKSDIERIGGAMERLRKISGNTYYLEGHSDRKAGVIAQDVADVLPEAVREGNNGYYAVSYNGVTALLVEAAKEQDAVIQKIIGALRAAGIEIQEAA